MTRLGSSLNEEAAVASPGNLTLSSNGFVLSVLVAVAYVATGYIGQVMAIPPGNVTILWPPAGIALASLHLFGRKVLPGIFIGAAIANGLSIFDGVSFESQLRSAAAILIMSIGSCLQPIVAQAVLTRFIGSRGLFDGIGMTLRSITIMAACCLISSTIGSQGLAATGFISSASVWDVFSTWWLGDLIGMLTFTSAILAIFRQSRISSILLMSAVVGAFTSTYVVSMNIRDQSSSVWHEHAARETERLTSTTLAWVEATLSPIIGMSAIFESSNDVYEEEFLLAAGKLEDHRPDFFPSALAVVNSIQNSDGSRAWEVLFSTNENSRFRVGSVVEPGSMGAQAIAEALSDPGQIVVSEIYPERENQGAIAIAAAAAGEEADSPVVIGILDIDLLINGLFAVRSPEGMTLRLYGAVVDEADEQSLQLYGNQRAADSTIATKSIRAVVAGTSFLFNWDITDQFLPGSRSELADTVLIGGIVGSAAFILFLTFLLGQNDQIRSRVRERTSELATKELVLRTAMDNMPGGICLLDENLCIQVLNDRYWQLYGRSPEDYVIGQPIANLIRQNIVDGVHTGSEVGDDDIELEVERRLADLHSDSFGETERYLADGRTLHVSHNPVAGGGVVLIVTDITERRRAEAAIETERENLSDILDNASQGMVLFSADRDPVVWNRRYPEALNIDPDALADKKFSILELATEFAKRGHYGDGDIEALAQARVDALWSGNSRSEASFDGKRIYDVQSQLTSRGGLVISYTDITEQKAVLNAVQSQEAQINAIMQSVPDAVITIDVAGTIKSINKSVEDVFGYGADELIGQNVKLLMPSDVSDQHDKYVAKYVETNEGSFLGKGSRELEGLHKSGRHFPIELSISEAVTAQERTFVGVARDISERKEAQEKINQERVRLVDAIEALDAGFVMFDKDEKLVICNDKYKGLFKQVADFMLPGAELEDIVRTSCEWYGLHKEEGLSVDQWVTQRIAEHRQHHKGVIQEINDRWYIKSDFATSDGGVVSLRYDVTELKVAERELADKEAMLTAALENMTGGLFMVDRDLNLRVFNDRFAEFYDFPRELLEVGAPLSNILRVRADRGEYGEGDPEELVDRRIAGYQSRDIQIVLDNVHERLIEVYRAPMDDGGVVCVFNDVTERKAAEDALSRAHSLITESLSYASRIQRSLLPPRTILREVFRDHTIIWEPKDMVGGDMVWLRPAKGGVYLIVADCTGHGPPGAFMTMICTGALDQAIVEMNEANPAEILQRMNTSIKAALGQDGVDGESDDGVELGVCFIDTEHDHIEFAGARFALTTVVDNTISEVKGDRSAIGYRHVQPDQKFTNHIVKIEKGMQFYMWSDGMVDQIGGEKRLSFGKRRLRRIILDYHKMEMSWQRNQILREFEDYQNQEARRDDVTFVGFIP